MNTTARAGAKDRFLQTDIARSCLPRFSCPVKVSPNGDYSRGREIGHVVAVHEIRVPELLKLSSDIAKISTSTDFLASSCATYEIIRRFVYELRYRPRD